MSVTEPETSLKRDKLMLATQAYTAARNRLQAAHQDEWMRYMHEERVARGLPPEPQPKSKPIEEKILDLEKKTAALYAEKERQNGQP